MSMPYQAFAFLSNAGLLVIRSRPDGWETWLDQQRLGERYGSAQQALDDLAHGTIQNHLFTSDSAKDLPVRIEDWKVVTRIEIPGGDYPRRSARRSD
jgi:hypothetical protein